MSNWDTTFELGDLTRKLTTANALLAYRESCARTLTLDAAEAQRKLRVRLMILESQYEKLYEEYVEDEGYIEKVEAALREAHASLRWHEEAVERHKIKNKELQDKLHDTLIGEQREQEAEAAALRASLEGALGEKKLLEERVLRLGDELEKVAVKKLNADFELASTRVNIKELEDEIRVLKGQHVEWEDKQRESIAERQTLQREIASLQLELEDLRKTVTRVTGTVAEKEEANKTQKQELAGLKAALKKETKAKEKAEKDLAKSKEDWEAKHKVLETKLENARNKANSLRAPSSAATTATSAVTKVPIDRPLKRQTLTMEDLEHSAKRQRKTPPKTSEFSITPFLKRQAAGIPHRSPDTPLIGEGSKGPEPIPPEESDAGERSVMLPAVGSKAPTKILLAGATRKKKATKRSIPIAEGEEDPGEQLHQPPILHPPSLKPTSLPLPSEQKQPRSLLSSPSPPPQPSGASPNHPKAKPRKRKAPTHPAGESSFYGRGIKPTVFDEDDGTGRLLLNNLGESQDPPLQPPPKKSLGVGGAGASGSGAFESLVPSVSAFNAEFSPPRKRPEALKKLFAGGGRSSKF